MSASFIMTDAEERFCPPELPMLRVDVVGGRLYLEICECHETNVLATYTKIASVAVHLEPFLKGLTALGLHDDIDTQEADKRHSGR